MLVDRRFLRVTLVTFLFFIYVGIQLPLIPRLIEEQLGGGEFDIGLSIAAFSISAVAVRPWLGRWSDRYGLKMLMGAVPSPRPLQRPWCPRSVAAWCCCRCARWPVPARVRCSWVRPR